MLGDLQHLNIFFTASRYMADVAKRSLLLDLAHPITKVVSLSMSQTTVIGDQSSPIMAGDILILTQTLYILNSGLAQATMPERICSPSRDCGIATIQEDGSTKMAYTDTTPQVHFSIPLATDGESN